MEFDNDIDNIMMWPPVRSLVKQWLQLTGTIQAIHLFPPNLGGSARILDIVHPISAVRHISQ